MPKFKQILIANRGEVAIRIARTCADLGIKSVAVYATDDADSLHVVKADAAHALHGSGSSAYLDLEAMVAAAIATRCDAIHPGYGFLSENSEFPRLCAEAGIVFIGPSADALDLFGDKARAVAHAVTRGVPVPRATPGGIDLEGARRFAEQQDGGVMIKAVVGGGGRGMRPVRSTADFEEAWRRCASEAQKAFGSSALYVEELIGRARHIEVQILGDGTGEVAHLFERECSVQRRFQKLVEIAPSPWLSDGMRRTLFDAALRIVADMAYVGVGTVEFLVGIDERGVETGRFWFIEMNPRLQVEHTVTEETTGVDLVHLQIQLASGTRITKLGIANVAKPRGIAIQMRVTMEQIGADGLSRPSESRLVVFEPPSGSGIRIETAAHAGYAANLNYDPLLTKLVVRSPSEDFSDAARRAYRALCEFDVGDAETNLPLLRALFCRDEFTAGLIDTGFIEAHAAEFGSSLQAAHPAFRRQQPDAAELGSDANDDRNTKAGEIVRASMQGRISAIDAKLGDFVIQGGTLALLEAMKMEHAVVSEHSGRVVEILGAAGDVVRAGAALFVIEPSDSVDRENIVHGRVEQPHPLLDTVNERHDRLLDAARPEAVARQRGRGALTARERIGLLCDSGSFMEFGSLVHSENSGAFAPADGVITGTARIDGRPAVVFAQDFTVFGGSAGHLGSAKVDRALAASLSNGIPLVMLLDGGGHRIQDGQNSRSYAHGAATFHDFARLSGWVPVVSAVLGAGFAANTNYSGQADFVVMLRGRATMGMAGPALVRAGTGEEIKAQALGGSEVQVDRHGLADLAVDSEPEAMAAIRQFLSYLPSSAAHPPPLSRPPDEADDAERTSGLLNAVPLNTRRNYDVKPIVELIADPGSVYEIKPSFARNIVTSFGRLDGRPVGFVANQALHAGGMLDASACEKGAHFIAMCDAFGLPLVYLIDVPGFSIGSDAERTTLGRRSARLIFELGHATVPRVSVVLRKGYGLGYVAMGGGRSFDADAAFAWPTAEICAMSVEGSVDVAYRSEFERAQDPAARRLELIEGIRSGIGPIQAAAGFGIDEIIDPRSTRPRLIEIFRRTRARRDVRQPPKHRPISPI